MGQTILVTGGAGFIGSNLVRYILENRPDDRVINLDGLTYAGNMESLAEFVDEPRHEFVHCDINNSEKLDEIMPKADVVLHLAAESHVDRSIHNPSLFLQTNIIGTFNILQASRGTQVERIVHTSTSEVYGTAQYIPIDEKHPLQPQSPYSASKIGADAMAMSFYYSFQLPLTVARPFNTYGPRQSARAVIPTIITQLAAGARAIKLGDLRPTRDFNFVLDTCKGMIMLAESDRTIGDVYNIGSNHEISIGELASKIMQLMGSEAEIISETERLRPQNSEVLRLHCDNQKIKQTVGFEPDFSLEEGLKMTIDWFSQKENLAKYKTDLYNI